MDMIQNWFQNELDAESNVWLNVSKTHKTVLPGAISRLDDPMTRLG